MKKLREGGGGMEVAVGGKGKKGVDYRLLLLKGKKDTLAGR